MLEKIKTCELPAFDAAPYLDSEEAIAAYLNNILETNDAALLESALDDVHRAKAKTA